MSEKNPGDVLTCDWNPFVGCVKYSPGCKHCWFLEAIFPWQQRLGNIPSRAEPKVPYFFKDRMLEKSLSSKNGIVGICQHGDLFWNRITDQQVHSILDLIDKVAPKKIAQRHRAGRPTPKYVLWTKRVKRMSKIMAQRYDAVPDWYGLGVSLENQKIVDVQLPHLIQTNGFHIAVMEPILGEIDLSNYIRDLDWVIVGSETGDNARLANHDWFRKLRDVTKAADKPFFIKQMGTSHENQIRILDGRTWEEFPDGYIKIVKGVKEQKRKPVDGLLAL